MNKISIIIPIYNSEKTLNKCLGSIGNQTYTDFEAICVNDASTDGSASIVKEFADKDNRFKLINKEHAGVSAARNLGIKYVTGDYIQFIDSDDFIEPDMLAIMLNALIINNADVAVCNYFHPSIKNYLGDDLLDLTKKCDMLKYMQMTFAFTVPWNKLYKRSVIKFGYDEEIHFTEDDLFGIANIFNAKKLVSIGRPLYHYYVAPNDTPLAQSSCINRMAKDPEFYRNRNTFWYKRTELLNKSLNYLKTYMSEDVAEEFAYVRIFDFMLWELIILSSVGVNKEHLKLEMHNIFNEREFKKSLEIKENCYGINFRLYKNELLKLKIDIMVDFCYDFCRTNCEEMTGLRPFYVCLGVFLRLFAELSEKTDKSDIAAKVLSDLASNRTREARYVNGLRLEIVA